jgi:hypothetical protein
LAYRIQRRHPRMSGGFPASVATGRWLASIPDWRAGLAAPALAAALAVLALAVGVALGMGWVVLRAGRAARQMDRGSS